MPVFTQPLSRTASRIRSHGLIRRDWGSEVKDRLGVWIIVVPIIIGVLLILAIVLCIWRRSRNRRRARLANLPPPPPAPVHRQMSQRGYPDNRPPPPVSAGSPPHHHPQRVASRPPPPPPAQVHRGPSQNMHSNVARHSSFHTSRSGPLSPQAQAGLNRSPTYVTTRSNDPATGSSAQQPISPTPRTRNSSSSTVPLIHRLSQSQRTPSTPSIDASNPSMISSSPSGMTPPSDTADPTTESNANNRLRRTIFRRSRPPPHTAADLDETDGSGEVVPRVESYGRRRGQNPFSERGLDGESVRESNNADSSESHDRNENGAGEESSSSSHTHGHGLGDGHSQAIVGSSSAEVGGAAAVPMSAKMLNLRREQAPAPPAYSDVMRS